jgi:alpha-N-arabinofuranosidase
LIETPDAHWFAVCLGVRPNGYPPCYHLGRETFLCPVTWADDDFPVIGDHGRVAFEMEAPSLAKPTPAAPPRDDFTSPALALPWNFLRNPEPRLYSLEERPGYLRLHGTAHGLDDVASPAWIGRRQCHFAVHAATCLEFQPEAPNEEAGLAVRMNEQHHYEIFSTRRDGRPSVVVRRRIGSLRAEIACQALSPGHGQRLVLAVDADRSSYSFSYGPSETELRPLAEGETRYLSTEVAGGFTGVYLAMYASGNGQPCRGPADFDWFDYSELQDGVS